MKSKHNRLLRLYHIAIAMSTTGALMSTAHATTYTWVNAGVVGTNYGGGSWNDTTANNTANWDTNGVPSNDGTADVVFSLSHNGWPMYAVNPASLTGNPTNWSINSLNYINSGTQADWGAPYIYGPSGYNDTRYSLSIGAGGINQNMLSSPEIGVPIIATASQPWNINNMAGNYTGGLTVKGNLTINNGVLITKNNGTSTTTPPTAWFSGGVVPSQVAFYNGTTTTVGTGAFALTGGGFLFSGVSQYGRLGTNPLTVTMNPSVRNDTSLAFQDSASGSFANNVALTAGYGSSLSLSYGNGSVDAGTTLTLTGTWSGTMRGGATNDRGFINVQNISIPYNNDDRNRLLIQGNNTGIVSLNPTDWTYGMMHIPQGVVVLNNTNAFGPGNSLSIFLGNNSNDTTNNFSGLLATSGNNVSAHINVRGVDNGSNQHRTMSEVGISGTGSVTFSGDIQMASTSRTMSAGVNGQGPNLPRLKLTAPAGGQANFTGRFIDNISSDPYLTPLIVLGCGTVKIAGNNAYKGTTSVRGGTLLLGGYNNALGYQGTGAANVSLGDTVVAPAGGDVAAATTNGNLPISGLSAGVLTFCSAVTTLDGVTLSTGNRVLLKDIAWNPEYSGVYTVTDTTHWTRSSDLNTASAYVAGLRVHVTGGTLNAGKNFYLQTGLWTTAVLGDNSGSSTSAKFLFNPDALSNIDVAILTDDARVISRNIDVTNNLSTGKSILGGNTAVASTFSGVVSLGKNLTVTSPSGGTTTFSGNIIGTNNVTKEGLGTVRFNTYKDYTGATSVTAGTLEVDDTLASSAVSVCSGGTLNGTGTLVGPLNVTGSGVVSPGLAAGDTLVAIGNVTITGHMTVKVDGASTTELVGGGSIDLSGGTVDVSVGGGGFTQPNYLIAEGLSLTGTLPNVTPGYVLTRVGPQMFLSQASFAAWMSINYPGFTGANAQPGADPEHDGLTNLVEYALDLNPTVSSRAPGVRTGNTLTFTKGNMAKADSNIAYSIEESTNLVTWGAPTLGSAVNGADTITYTFPSGKTNVFARLKVIQTP